LEIQTVKRVHVHLSTRQIDYLKAEADRLGLTVAETIRRQLDQNLVLHDERPRQPQRPSSSTE